jgi:class 3 adenylate cyclase
MENTSPSSDIKGHRTLATVVFTDCVGFSARMSENEDHTLDLIRRDLKLMKRICVRFEGRVLKSTGDGLLMHFISAVKAVECAIEIQHTLTAAAATLASADQLQHRIGIHLADMFITETDVMGNGVNIAARLQSIADPNGICISQTVYDVIKAGLHLQTKFLGPQDLKNIREVVPAYKILLSPEADATDPIGDAVRQLEQHPNLARIKKLILYACQTTWESDPNKLHEINLLEFVQTLLRSHPTLDRLERFLDTAARSLSKPREYALVAQTILETVAPLYPHQPLHRAAVSVESTVALQPAEATLARMNYRSIAQELEASPNGLRIKKLLLYVCCQRWENDPQHLNQVQLPELLATVHQQSATLERLQRTVNHFVQTLSKRTEYALIASTIVNSLERLYPADDAKDATPQAVAEADVTVTEPPALAVPSSAMSRYSEVVAALEQHPEVSRIKKLLLYVCQRQWESDTGKLTGLDIRGLVESLHRSAPTIGQLEGLLTSMVKTVSKPTEYGAIAQIILRTLGQLYPEYSSQGLVPVAIAPLMATSFLAAPEPPQPDASEAEDSRSPFNLFDARLGIMKSANPLRAKIVIFSALHTDFGFSRQDWLSLRMYELDSFLRQLLDLCKSYTDLEALLYATARRLHDPEANVEIANVIIKCLRPFYLYGCSISALTPVVEATQVHLDLDETRLELEPADEDDRTCELLPDLRRSNAVTQIDARPAAVTSEVDLVPGAPLVDRSSASLGEVEHARD